MEFSKRQAGGIKRFFEGISVPEDQQDAHRLSLVNALDRGPDNPGVCEVCGHGGIRYEFHLTDTERGGDFIAGSNCIGTFLGANKHLVGKVEDEAKRLIKQARKNKQADERNKSKTDLDTAIQMISDLAVQTDSDESKVLEMLTTCRDSNYSFTEPRRKWARDRVRYLRALTHAN